MSMAVKFAPDCTKFESATGGEASALHPTMSLFAVYNRYSPWSNDAVFSLGTWDSGQMRSLTNHNGWVQILGHSVSINIATIASDETHRVVAFTIDTNANPKIHSYVNGMVGSTGSPNFYSWSNTNLIMGWRPDVGNPLFYGHISEIILYQNALSTSDVASIGNFLAQKHGMNMTGHGSYGQ